MIIDRKQFDLKKTNVSLQDYTAKPSCIINYYFVTKKQSIRQINYVKINQINYETINQKDIVLPNYKNNSGNNCLLFTICSNSKLCIKTIIL